jgi:hypothetical protein
MPVPRRILDVRGDMREKDKRGGKTAFVLIKVMLSDPCGIEAVTLGMNELLARQPIPLRRCRPIEEPGEEAEPSRSGLRHDNLVA